MDDPYYGDPLLKGSPAVGIASSFFVIASLCVAIPIFIWSLRSLYVCRKNGGRVSVFIIFLLLNVLLQMVFSPTLVKLLLKIPCSSRACEWTEALLVMTDLCGLYLHQLVALESVLSLRLPLYTAYVFSLPCSITLSISLYVFSFACVIVYVAFAFPLPSTGILAVTFILSCKTPPTSHLIPETARGTRQWVLALAMVTMIVVYLPSLVTQYVQFHHYVNGFDGKRYLDAAFEVTFSLRSLRLVSDTLLSVLVCKKVLPVQFEHTQAESGADRDLSLNWIGGVA